MVNFKDWNVKMLGHALLLTLVIIIVVAIVMTFGSHILMAVFPSVFASALTLSETLLLLILIRLFVK